MMIVLVTLKPVDSLDENFTDSSSSCSEVDSSPGNNYCGQIIAVETPTHSPATGRPQTREGFYSRVGTRGGTSAGTRRASHNLPPNKWLSCTISDDETISPKDPSSDSEVDEPLSGIWKDNPPTIKDFSFNEQIGLWIDLPENASPIFFSELFWIEKLVDDLVKKTNEYSTKLVNHNQPMKRNHYGIRGKMSTLMKWKSLSDSFLVWDWFHFSRTKGIGAMICFARMNIFLPLYQENDLNQSCASSTLHRSLCLTMTSWVRYAWSLNISIKPCSNW